MVSSEECQTSGNQGPQRRERLREHDLRLVTEATDQGFGIMALVAHPDGNVFALWEDKIPGIGRFAGRIGVHRPGPPSSNPL